MNPFNPKHHTRSIYIDVEMTCWLGPPPFSMKQEIIEIGAVEMDLPSLEITREKAHFVRPRRWEISDRCTKLTGITSDDIRKARPFPEVLASVMEEFSLEKGLCCTWGDDAGLIAGTCQSHGLKTPLRNLIDLANLVQRLFLLRDMVNLGNAIEMLGLEFEGVPHTALADAKNTARVHAAIIRRIRREQCPGPPSVIQNFEAASPSPFGAKLQAALHRSKT